MTRAKRPRDGEKMLRIIKEGKQKESKAKSILDKAVDSFEQTLEQSQIPEQKVHSLSASIRSFSNYLGKSPNLSETTATDISTALISYAASMAQLSVGNGWCIGNSNSKQNIPIISSLQAIEACEKYGLTPDDFVNEETSILKEFWTYCSNIRNVLLEGKERKLVIVYSNDNGKQADEFTFFLIDPRNLGKVCLKANSQDPTAFMLKGADWAPGKMNGKVEGAIDLNASKYVSIIPLLRKMGGKDNEGLYERLIAFIVSDFSVKGKGQQAFLSTNQLDVVFGNKQIEVKHCSQKSNQAAHAKGGGRTGTFHLKMDRNGKIEYIKNQDTIEDIGILYDDGEVNEDGVKDMLYDWIFSHYRKNNWYLNRPEDEDIAKEWWNDLTKNMTDKKQANMWFSKVKDIACDYIREYMKKFDDEYFDVREVSNEMILEVRG